MALKAVNVDLNKFNMDKDIEVKVFKIFEQLYSSLIELNKQVDFNDYDEMVSFVLAVENGFATIIYGLHNDNSLMFIAGVQFTISKIMNNPDNKSKSDYDNTWVNPIAG